VLTVADINGPEDNETHLWTLTKEQYNAFNMEVQKDEEQELEVEDDDQVAYEGNSQRFYSKEALRRAESVKETQAKCGKFSLRKLYEAFLSGAITNTEGYTKSQIMTADEILGSDVDYLKGVYTEKQQFKGTEGEPNPNEGTEGEPN
jgi:hypothetical protein